MTKKNLMGCDMHNKILNITNGDYFNKTFISEYGRTAVPFCEAMMDGEVTADIYSPQFIAIRAKMLNVTENEYRARMYVYDTLKNNNYQTIHLWFGKDTFCQMNLLTLLAYLEQIEYQGELKLNYIDDETFEVLDADIDIKLGIYNKIYEDVFISKSVPDDVGVLCAKAIDLYFDYHSENGKLANLIRANTHKEKMELVCLLLGQSKDYGLSDLQAERLIGSNLPN